MDSRRSTIWSLLLVTLWMGAAGCATGSSTEDVDPRVEALEASHRQVRRSVEDAYQRSERLDDYTVRARYNPPRCDAPEFELRVHGRWTRVYLDAGSELEEPLASLAADETGVEAGGGIEFRGIWRGNREAETGLEYPVFWVKEIAR